MLKGYTKNKFGNRITGEEVENDLMIDHYERLFDKKEKIEQDQLQFRSPKEFMIRNDNRFAMKECVLHKVITLFDDKGNYKYNKGHVDLTTGKVTPYLISEVMRKFVIDPRHSS